MSVLRAYAENVGAISGKWHLVTGPRDEIYSISRQAYFADEDLGLQRTTEYFLHSENFILLDWKRRIRGIYKGTFPADVRRLIEDIEILKAERR